MTPKEKAAELIEKYKNSKDEFGYDLFDLDSSAKQCALIAVDEILKITWVDKFLITEDYWQEVKQEIELL